MEQEVLEREARELLGDEEEESMEIDPDQPTGEQESLFEETPLKQNTKKRIAMSKKKLRRKTASMVMS